MVKKYKKVADIISLQVALVKEYKTAYRNFRNSGQFTVSEIDYMRKVYERLFNESLKHVDDLVNVLVPGKMRMSDAERLNVIDQIYSGMSGKVSFLRHFNSNTSLLGMQRAHEQHDDCALRTNRQVFNYLHRCHRPEDNKHADRPYPHALSRRLLTQKRQVD